MRLYRWSAVLTLIVLGFAAPASAERSGPRVVREAQRALARSRVSVCSSPSRASGTPPASRSSTGTSRPRRVWPSRAAIAAVAESPTRPRPGAYARLRSTPPRATRTRARSGSSPSASSKAGWASRSKRALPGWAAVFEPSVAAGATGSRGTGYSEWRFTLSPEITIKLLKFISPERVRSAARTSAGDWRGLD